MPSTADISWYIRRFPHPNGKPSPTIGHGSGEYLEPIQIWRKETGGKAFLYVGSFQDTYPQYYYGYRHCLWLEQNARAESGVPVFFYDYLGEYLRSLIPQGELQRAFYVYRSRIPAEKLRSYVEIIGALIRTNYNFGKAAELLFVHKNTLVYRYNGMKAHLAVDPLASAADRAFLEAFYAYLTRSGEPFVIAIGKRNTGRAHLCVVNTKCEAFHSHRTCCFLCRYGTITASKPRKGYEERIET